MPIVVMVESVDPGLLLKVTMTRLDTARMETWLMQRPFAAALPIQPMLVKPLHPQPPAGIQITFRRKPSSEKGGTDGGLRCTVACSEVDGDESSDESGVLLVTRISEGQTISKAFSERALIKRLLTDLATLPEDCGAVSGVLNLIDTS